MPQKPTIASTSFTTSQDTPRAQHMELWQNYLSGIFDVSHLTSAKRQFRADAKSFQLPGAILSSYSVTESVIRRDLQRLNVDGEGLLVITMFESGHIQGVLNDRNLVMLPGTITMFDFQQSLHAKMEDANYKSLTVSHSAVGYDPLKHPRLFQIDVGTPAGQMLQRNLEWLWEIAPTASVGEARTLAEGVSALVRGLVTRNLPDETLSAQFAQSREVAVRRFIKAHLRDPELQPNMICASLGLSRAVLYRLFEGEGGVRKAIQSMRLDQAVDELSKSERVHGAISRVASNWSFHDQAHFSRIFRSRFGFRPTDIVGSGLSLEEHPTSFARRQTTISEVNPLRSLYPRAESAFPPKANLISSVRV